MRRFCVLLLSLLGLTAAVVAPAAAAEPVVAATPPMGISWSRGWNQCPRIDDAKVRAAIDMLVTSGLRDAGYRYVNIGNCWAAKTRAADGTLQPDAAKFPDLPGLIAYAHGNGLKFGLHSGTGTVVCGSFMPGSRDREDVDAQTFAGWGVDYLEYDTCGGETGAGDAVKKMSDALTRTGRPIVLAALDLISNHRQWEWAPAAGAHTWQVNPWLDDNFFVTNTVLDSQIPLAGHTGPGGWSDPGLLQFGYQTAATRQAQFSLWALMNAPLFVNETFPADTMGNAEVIAVDQDWSGTPGRKVRDLSEGEIWAKPMSDGSVAVLLLNRGAYARTIPFDLAESGIAAAPAYRVRNLWTGAELTSTGTLRASVPALSGVFLRVWPGQPSPAEPLVTLGVQLPEGFLAGQPVTGTVTLTNDGDTPVTDARYAITAPAGWQLDGPAQIDVPRVSPGSTVTQEITLRPATAPAAKVLLTAAGTYTTEAGARTAAGSAESPLVTAPGTGTTYLDTRPWPYSENGLGPVERGSVANGARMSIGGTGYAPNSGIGVHAPSVIRLYLGGACKSFTTQYGVDDAASPQATVAFRVLGDGRELFATGVVGRGAKAQKLTVPVAGVQQLAIAVDDGGDGSAGEYADWIAPNVSC
ncbi:NPCBM/NEW2 domain-containing protein [Amycolatopsis australiensis]|uniref:Alpha-galactosidase n=1 Tax=Amycolatopsis australiensis TaxID=546364 RepID=A0A1K1R5E9_9PSEU|nr:NPCBM/NEW2 domain-containing protein [Amycolatopsis australiensis]SFW67148.1 alpha-galactosidase [Amycolatopsis australiensis]